MNKPRILIVEDQILISTNIRLLLKFNNFEVFGVAQNAEEALSILENDQPDLILMDISLPGDIDGIEVANQINQRWSIPIIYITARKDAKTIERAKASSPYGYITKDVELKEQLPLLLEFALYKHNVEKERENQRLETLDSEEKFRSIASSAKDAIIFIDNNGLVSYWNDSATRIFGYSEIETLQRPLADLIAPKAFMEYYFRGFTDFRDSGKGNFVGKTIELEAIKKNGDNFPIEASMASVMLKGKWCACCIIRDISVRKTTEEEIERLIEELQISKDVIEQNANEVMILNAKLYESEEKLQELNASKDRFFSIIAHDLKGPFTSLLGYSEILSTDIDTFSPFEIKDFATDLNDSAKQLFKLLENLLHWTRLQRDSIEINIVESNLKILIGMSLDILTFQANQKKIELINNVDESFKVIVDINMMNTVFRNLISNAIKFSHSNGKIEINAKIQNGNKIEISIRDNGVGMDEMALSKIFRIDVQHTTSGTANEKGTGLGLVLCKELVEKIDGTIKVESQVNIGTTFFITIPRAN